MNNNEVNLLKKYIEFFYKAGCSFLGGVIINDLSKTNTNLKIPMESYGINILETHSSFQHGLEINNLIYLLAITLSFNFFNLNKINRKFINKIVQYEILIFMFLKGLSNGNISNKNISFLLMIFIVLYYFIFFVYDNYSIDKDENKEKELYLERKLDLERIEEALSYSNAIGIDSEWGQGKTFLLEKIQNNNREVIFISILSVSEEDILIGIIKQLDSILRKNKIFGFHSSALKKMVSNQNILGINFAGLFLDQTKKEAIKSYIEIFKKLKKETVIIFDDLDRVEDRKKIERIFEIGDSFKTEYVKIVYLFSQKKLYKNNLNLEYIEKFVPIIYKLTKLKFENVLEKKINELDELKKYVEVDDFNFIIQIMKDRLYKYRLEQLRGEVFERFHTEKIINQKDKLKNTSIREIENFLLELLINLKMNEKLKLNIDKRILIAFSFIKKIMYIDFNEIESLDKSYPIKMIFEDTEKDTEKDIEEFYIIRKIIENNYREEYNKIKVLDKYISLKEIEDILLKFKIDYEKLENKLSIKEKEIKKMIVTSEGEENLIIHSLFNYPTKFYFEENEFSIVLDKRDKINKTIKKLIYIGNRQLQSNYEFIYEKLVPILKEQDLEQRSKKFFNLLNDNINDPEYRSVNYDSNGHIPKIIEYLGNKQKEELLKNYVEMCLQGDELYNAMLNRINQENILENSEYRKIIYQEIIKKKSSENLDKKNIRYFLLKLAKGISLEYELNVYYFLGENLFIKEEESFLFNCLETLMEQLKRDVLNIYILEEVSLYNKFIQKIKKIYNEETILEEGNKVQTKTTISISENILEIIQNTYSLDEKDKIKFLKELLEKKEINARELKYILNEIITLN